MQQYFCKRETVEFLCCDCEKSRLQCFKNSTVIPMSACVILAPPVWKTGERGLPYINDGDARWNFQFKQPLKVTILGVAPANFIP